MKKVLFAAVAASVLTLPALSFAQVSPDNNGPTTRAEVKQDLRQVEGAGYDPNDWNNYPQNIQSAENRVNQEQGTTVYPVAQPYDSSSPSYGYSSYGSSSYGSSSYGTSQSGIGGSMGDPTLPRQQQPYFGQ